jgi:hypothetical protein
MLTICKGQTGGTSRHLDDPLLSTLYESSGEQDEAERTLARLGHRIRTNFVCTMMVFFHLVPEAGERIF